MNKRLQSLGTQSFRELVDKISAGWQLRTQPNTPGQPGKNKSAEEILRDLVAMPTVTGNYEANHEAIEYIVSLLKEHGLYVTRHEWNGVESLVATTKRKKTPTVLLAAHVDVVPATPGFFQLKEEDNKYFGRGVYDMKAAIAAYLSILHQLPGNLHDYDFGIMITTDEEVGGFDGAAQIVKEGYLPKIVILPDGAGDWNLEGRSKGTWFITLTASGKEGHGSRPWEGENAIDKLLQIIRDIQMLFPESLGPDTSTINVGTISAGEVINQVPSKATASLDIRTIDQKDDDKLRKKISSLCAAQGIQLKEEVYFPPMAHDTTNAYLQEYAKCVEDTIGRSVQWITSIGGNEGLYFAQQGIPCAIGYPTGGAHHSENEWLSKDALVQLQEALVAYLQRVAYVSSSKAKVARKTTS